MRSDNSKSESILTDRRVELAASEIIEYAQSVTNGVMRVRQRANCTDDMISFDPPPFAGSMTYYNAKAPVDRSCHVFSPNGGAVSYRTFPKGWRRQEAASPIAPIFTGSNCVPAVGTGDDGDCVGNSDPSDSELIMLISGLKEDICTMVNKKLGTRTGSVPVIFDETPFNGTYLDIKNANMDSNILNSSYKGVEAACFQSFGSGRFYKVVLAR